MFSIYFPTYEKLKSFVEISTPYNQILIFKELLCMSNMAFLYLKLARPKLTVQNR
jgi:hypothetical protein